MRVGCFVIVDSRDKRLLQGSMQVEMRLHKEDLVMIEIHTIRLKTYKKWVVGDMGNELRKLKQGSQNPRRTLKRAVHLGGWIDQSASHPWYLTP